MTQLPAPQEIPTVHFNNLRIKDIKPIISYYNKLSPDNPLTYSASKAGHVECLRKCLQISYDRRSRSTYEKLIGYIAFVSGSRTQTHSFSRYTQYLWKTGHVYQIPTTGPWVQFAQQHQAANSHRPSTYRVTTGVPSAVPGGLVSGQFLNSPAAPPPHPAPVVYNMPSEDLEKIVFEDYGLLFPTANLVVPSICAESPYRLHSKAIAVKLSEDQLDLLQSSASDPDKDKYGLHLFISSYAAFSIDRRLNKNASARPYMPQKLQVKVNGAHESSLLQSTDMRARPIDLTQLFQMTSEVANRVDINYMSHVPLIVVLALTVQHTPQSMAGKIRKTNLETVDKVRQQFFGKQSDDDDVIAEGALVNLKCPLGLCRIKVPCRSKQCQHSQCFDCATFLQFYNTATVWKCPVCSVGIKSWNELVVDGYFEDILQKTSENDEQVFVEPNGDWKLKQDATIMGGIVGKISGRPLDVDEEEDAIDLSDLSETGNKSSGRHKRRRTDYVDLTIDSDSEDAGEEDLQSMTQEEIEMIIALEADAGSANGSSGTTTSASSQFTPRQAAAQPVVMSSVVATPTVVASAPAVASTPVVATPTVVTSSIVATPTVAAMTSVVASSTAVARTSVVASPSAIAHPTFVPSSTVPTTYGPMFANGQGQVSYMSNVSTPTHANPAMPFPFAPIMAVSGAPPPGAHLPGYYGPFVTSTNDAVAVTYRPVPPQHPFMMPTYAHHAYTTMPMISQPAQAIGAIPGQIRPIAPAPASPLTNLSPTSHRSTVAHSVQPAAAAGRLATTTATLSLSTPRPRAQRSRSVTHTPVNRVQSRTSLAPATAPPNRKKSATKNSRKSVSGSANRWSTSSNVRAPTATVNTTVADMEITGTGARAAQLRRSRALATPSLRSTTTTGATARASTVPALSRGMSDPRSIGSSAHWALATPSRVRPSMNGHHSSSAIVTTSPLQNSGSVPSLSSPLRSPHTPLVGVSPTYMSLFQRPQSNNTSHNGPYRPESL
ncbi:E3 SUMO-protein ligase pli1 [Coemansia sp. RSA 1972]|nr:E3 SUMO-protein ligase pli1 [Coemansia sp. RSA 1972]